jgi:hypothetical protein
MPPLGSHAHTDGGARSVRPKIPSLGSDLDDDGGGGGTRGS